MPPEPPGGQWRDSLQCARFLEQVRRAGCHGKFFFEAQRFIRRFVKFQYHVFPFMHDEQRVRLH